MKRSEFLRLAGIAGLGFPFVAKNVFAASPSRKITILHTNDTHSRIDPFPATDPKYAGLGGMARRSSLVNAIRRSNKQTLLLDAGDVFQGTPYFNYFHGKLSFELMSKMGYDAGTLGNHEFDNGVQGFVDVAPNATFPFVNSNYMMPESPMEPFIKNFVIKEMNGVRIGIFGLGIDFNHLVLDNLHRGVRYRDALAVGNGISRNLKKYLECDYVICLSHLGYMYNSNKIDDLKLAAGSEHIDLIIGGHTHTFLDKPTEVMNKSGRTVLVTQVGFGGIILGHIDLFFSEKKELLTYRSLNKTVGLA